MLVLLVRLHQEESLAVGCVVSSGGGSVCVWGGDNPRPTPLPRCLSPLLCSVSSPLEYLLTCATTHTVEEGDRGTKAVFPASAATTTARPRHPPPPPGVTLLTSSRADLVCVVVCTLVCQLAASYRLPVAAGTVDYLTPAAPAVPSSSLVAGRRGGGDNDVRATFVRKGAQKGEGTRKALASSMSQEMVSAERGAEKCTRRQGLLLAGRQSDTRNNTGD